MAPFDRTHPFVPTASLAERPPSARFATGATVAVIPARGGSRGVPRKAERCVGGIPLLSRAVAAARAARTVDRVIVNTEDAALATLAHSAGADVPVQRPAELAGDHSPVIDAVVHLCGALEDRGETLPEFLVLVQCTSPFTTGLDLDNAFRLFAPEVDAVVACCPSEVMPDWLRNTDADGYLRPVAGLDVPQHRPRQQMRPVYRLTGAFYWIRTAVLLEARTFLPPRTRPHVLPANRAVDVDTEWDLRLAQFLATETAHV